MDIEEQFNKQVIVIRITHVVRQDLSIVKKIDGKVMKRISNKLIEYPQIKCNEEYYKVK